MNRLKSRRKQGDPKSQNSCVKNRFRYTEKPTVFVRKKRSFLCAAFPGSLTLEAAIALPVCMLILLSFLLLFQAMEVQLTLQQALSDTGRMIAAGYEAADIAAGERNDSYEKTAAERLTEELLYHAVSETVLKGVMNRKLEERLPDSPVIRGGTAGISYAGSRYDRADGNIILQAAFRLSLPFDAANRLGFRLTQRSVHRAWTGKETDSSGREETVYVTESGTVYHTSRSCTHLRLSIRETDTDSVGSLRNTDGGKYYPCEFCGDQRNGGTVYVTDAGDRYHYNKNCSGLKRTVTAVPISAVGDRKLCTRCRKKDSQ